MGKVIYKKKDNGLFQEAHFLNIILNIDILATALSSIGERTNFQLELI